jgi:hypothetical protein
LAEGLVRKINPQKKCQDVFALPRCLLTRTIEFVKPLVFYRSDETMLSSQARSAGRINNEKAVEESKLKTAQKPVLQNVPRGENFWILLQFFN